MPFFPFLQTAEPSEPLLLFLLKRSLHMLPCERETMSHKRLNVYALFLHTHVSVYIFLACDGACRRSCWLGKPCLRQRFHAYEGLRAVSHFGIT